MVESMYQHQYLFIFITHFCKIKVGGGGDLLESPIHFRYGQNILFRDLMTDFCEIVNLGHFLKFEKISNSLKFRHVVYRFEARVPENQNI